ncbi:MAG: hypothetical protein JKY60_08570 [Kordiimonadaceae bacterium]|nr:hypothetical protein [Kordiimonadaceae bacterium]
MFRNFFEKRALKMVGSLNKYLQAKHGVQTYFDRCQLDEAIDKLKFPVKHIAYVYARYLNEAAFNALDAHLRKGMTYEIAHEKVVSAILGRAAEFEVTTPKMKSRNMDLPGEITGGDI